MSKQFITDVVVGIILAAESDGVIVDDGNVVDLIADNTTATLADIRRALIHAGLSKRFPNAVKERKPTGVQL